jgi:prepilin-type N-terminal cleavage/methylation domain-containing protein
MKKAFTLIELMIVIAILAILASVILPIIGHVNDKANGQHSTYYPVTLPTGKNISYGAELFIIDGCQYIRWNGGLAHKGNCTNSIHSHNQ